MQSLAMLLLHLLSCERNMQLMKAAVACIVPHRLKPGAEFGMPVKSVNLKYQNA